MHEFPLLLAGTDRARAERVAREAECRGEHGIRIAERYFSDGSRVSDVYSIKEKPCGYFQKNSVESIYSDCECMRFIVGIRSLLTPGSTVWQ